jgi:hypothetical protein
MLYFARGRDDVEPWRGAVERAIERVKAAEEEGNDE